MDKLTKVHFYISLVLRISVLIAIAWAIIGAEWFSLFMAILMLFLMFLPSLIEKNYKLVLPIEAEFPITLFLYLTIFLGEAHGFYTLLWWWDLFLHTLSGLLMAWLGFILVYTLNTPSRIHLNLSPGFIAIFAFTFALSIGTLWELIEYASDIILQTTMQGEGIDDTMTDLAVDALGAIVISTLGYISIRKRRKHYLSLLINIIIEKNPLWFPKEKIKKFIKSKKEILISRLKR